MMGTAQPYLPWVSFNPRLQPKRSMPETGDAVVRFGKQLQPTPVEKTMMQRAVTVSRQSKDPNSKVGAVITGANDVVLSEDYNHFPPGIDESPSERWERPAKYEWTGHAEVNAICAAAKKGIALAGSRIYVNWFPCTPCARAVISCGIKELVGFTPDYNHPRWGNDFKFVKKMLDEAGIKMKLFPEPAYSP